MKTARHIRQDFLNFFKERGHTIVPSDLIVPGNDPTLLFTNAGMNQFKDVFLGEGQRDYVRAVDTQKCLRVSGKHNDLEEVGYDTYHHTFFEMLGNWSFGDYFKKEATAWAWELLTEVWELDPTRFYVTVHAGDESLGLQPDEEAAGFWRSETGIDPDHILYGDSSDNFWMMGDTGPCGPCSEIHIDLRSDAERASVPGATLVNKNDPRVMEIWNLVFIQYNALPDGSLQPLAAKHVDTGLGFERMVAVLQQKTSNYDTDLFLPILNRAAELSPLETLVSYDDAGGNSDDEREGRRIALRVVADHVRTLAFAVADGVVPGNAGRGYVIRRILRRAVRYGYQTLELHTPFLYDLLQTVRELMADAFPELDRDFDHIVRIVRAEEESFLETLGTGLLFFERLAPYVQRLSDSSEAERAVVDLGNDRHAIDLLEKGYAGEKDRTKILDRFTETAEQGRIPGEIAFLLHDTYGFPVDLTQLIARESGFAVDLDRYDELMEEQKSRARAAAHFSVDQSAADTWRIISNMDDSIFTGYESALEEDVSVCALRAVGEGTDRPVYELILERTPFYAESGGQVGDTGMLLAPDQSIRVLDTKKQSGHIVHIVDTLPEDPECPFIARVDEARRARIVKHHSVTHLLHAALREVLGSHVAQKGSLVAPDHLRFDFSHYDRVTPEELRRVEVRVNEMIQRNIERREDRDVPIKEALARGAMALFGEKYGDTVRVITFDSDYSVELCGGLHVAATGEIGLLKLKSEGSVAAGIRRIVAVAGTDALDYLESELNELRRVRDHFRSLQRPSDEEVSDLIAQNRELQKHLDHLRKAEMEMQLDRLVETRISVATMSLVTGVLEHADMEVLRKAGELMRLKLGNNSVGILGSKDPEAGKVYLVCSVSEDLIKTKKLNAGTLVGVLAKQLGGGGGGRPGLATAGGRQPELLEAVLEKAPDLLAEMSG